MTNHNDLVRECAAKNRAARDADHAWQAGMESVYGKDAGDARYDPNRNAVGHLRGLRDAFEARIAEWHGALDALRAAGKSVRS